MASRSSRTEGSSSPATSRRRSARARPRSCSADFSPASTNLPAMPSTARMGASSRTAAWAPWAGCRRGASRDRYGQQDIGEFSKLVPEGVEAHVKCVGPLEPFLHQLVGGLRAGMKYVGAATIEDLRTRSTFVRISGAGLRESHPHDVRITTEPPNYRIKA